MEDVANGPEAFKMNRFLGIFFEIFSKANDEVVHGPGGGSPGVPPADFKKLLAGEGVVGILNEELQQLSFLPG